jgi:hypothetical protein
MYTFLKEVKSLRPNFTQSETELEIPFENVNFYISGLDSQTLSIKLGTEQNEVYGAIRLTSTEYRGVKYKMVVRVCTTEKYRGNGVMKLLYSHCLELDLNIMSDSTHTTFGSKDFWIKAIDYFPEKSIYMINLNTNYKRIFSNQEENKIWGKEDDDDFDVLENADKIALLESLHSDNELSKEQLDFFTKNIKELKNLESVRLTME